MKVIVIGGNGTIGRAVVEELGHRHDVISVGQSSGELRVDMTRPESVLEFFRKTGPVDAVVVAAGKLHFGPLAELTSGQLSVGLQDKLMGQINIALEAQRHLNDGGSITLTSGIVSDQPIRFGINATMVNAAVDGFVRAAAIEMPRGLRINVVSPNVLVESMHAYGPYFHGFEPVTAARTAKAYSRSVDGLQTGQVYKVW
jgi:NAD(P)-dependent dehydrogenase (short-subunit alcohol dehydrogenase family)